MLRSAGRRRILSYRGEPTRLEIGSGCTIREGVTMNVGTVKGGGLTRVGDNGYFMNNSHVGHDCMVGSDVIFATSATLGGHCEIGDFVYHRRAFRRASVHARRAAGDGRRRLRRARRRDSVRTCQWPVCGLEGLNIIGMKRRKFTRERLATVRAFYQKLFHGPGIFAERLEAVQPMAKEDPAIAEILAFIGDGKHRRAVSSGRRRPAALTTGSPQP